MDPTTSCTEQEVSQAIDASKAENRTVELDYTEAAEGALYAECESHDDNGLFWGQDCDGNKWSVRLV